MSNKDKLLFNSDDIKILVLNKMEYILKNIDDNSKGEISDQLYGLKDLILMY